MQSYFYRGSRLPHLQPPNGTFFITARLFGSVPQPVIQAIKARYQEELIAIKKEQNALLTPETLLSPDLRMQLNRIQRKKEVAAGKKYFIRFDDFLDRSLNEPHWFRNPDVAKLLTDAIHFYEGKYYDLWAYTIMSNHIHLLITMLPNTPMLWKVMLDLKKYTGLHSNRLLGRSGHFWEEESYDHLVRPGEFERIRQYILQNPVKAGIVSTWEEYPWNYVKPDSVRRYSL